VKARNGSLERKRLKYNMSGSPESAWNSRLVIGFFVEALALGEGRLIMKVEKGWGFGQWIATIAGGCNPRAFHVSRRVRFG
jgi:hypothetical protein